MFVFASYSLLYHHAGDSSLYYITMCLLSHITYTRKAHVIEDGNILTALAMFIVILRSGSFCKLLPFDGHIIVWPARHQVCARLQQ